MELLLVTTPLLQALYEGRTDDAHVLADQARAQHQLLTLPEAAALGRPDEVRAALAGGASVEAPAPDGWPPLHLAAFFGHDHIVQLLLRHGASPRTMAASAQGNTPLHAALAGRGSMPLIAALVDAGADVHAADAHHVRPVHLAAARGNLDALTLLVQHGARLDVRMPEGTQPIDLARARGHTAAAEWINAHTRAEMAS